MRYRSYKRSKICTAIRSRPVSKELFEIDPSCDDQSIRRLTNVPIPPSANDMYQMRTVQGGKRRFTRILKKTYETWRKEAFWVVRSQLGDHLRAKTPFTISIRVHLDRKGDIDNRIKPLLDMLKYAGIIHDDRYCDYLSIERDLSLEKNTIWMEIKGEWYRRDGRD